MTPSFDGFLVIDKPAGMTSRDVVNRTARWFPPRTRIGHTGTLDPLATGVLVLAIGAGTRLTEYVQRMSKVYRAGITLGGCSDTDDADGVITPTPVAQIPGGAEVRQALESFVGIIEQTPPQFSAAKVVGRRAYALARKGEEFSLSSRPVTIHAIDIEALAGPELTIVIHCGKGTYIRSIARDLGQKLGCGGYIHSLRRLRVGCFGESDACRLDVDRQTAPDRLLPLDRAVNELPRVDLDPDHAVRLLCGQHLAISADVAGEVAVYSADGNLLAIADINDGVLHARKNLANRSNPARLPDGGDEEGDRN